MGGSAGKTMPSRLLASVVLSLAIAATSLPDWPHDAIVPESFSQVSSLPPVPTWIIAHQINSPNEIKWYAKGANAIESDLRFDKVTSELKRFFHGGACDIGRNCIHESKPEVLVRALADRYDRDPNEFTLWHLDLKLSNLVETSGAKLRKGGKNLAAFLKKEVLNRMPKLHILVGFENEAQVPFVESLVAEIQQIDPGMSRFGFDCSEPTKWKKEMVPRELQERLGIQPNQIWASDGISNWISTFRSDTEFKKCLKERRDGKVARAYFWTVDNINDIEHYFHLGADAVITNKPENALNALSRFAADGRRLATIDDNPFSFRERKPSEMQARWCAYHAFSSLFSNKFYCAKRCTAQRDGKKGTWCWTNKRCNDNLDCQENSSTTECWKPHQEHTCGFH